MNSIIVRILGYNYCCRRFFTQFYDRIIIRNWRTFSVFDFYKDIFRVGVAHHNINFFSFFTAPEVTNRCGILIWQYGQRKSHPVRKTVQATLPGKSSRVVLHRVFYGKMLPGRSFPYLPELYEAEGLADVSSLCMPVL